MAAKNFIVICSCAGLMSTVDNSLILLKSNIGLAWVEIYTVLLEVRTNKARKLHNINFLVLLASSRQ